MDRKPYGKILCIVLLLAGWIALPGAGGALPRPTPQTPQTPQTIAPSELPEHVVYWHMFRHVIALNKKAEEMEKKGEDGARFRLLYKRNAGLSDGQAGVLNQIAHDCAARVARKDQEARQLINAARARFPEGRIEDGQTPPPPPARLKTLQQERDAIILEERDRLREAFGDEEFGRFREFVEKSVAPRIRTVFPELQRPAGPREPALLPPGAREGRRTPQ